MALQTQNLLNNTRRGARGGYRGRGRTGRPYFATQNLRTHFIGEHLPVGRRTGPEQSGDLDGPDRIDTGPYQAPTAPRAKRRRGRRAGRGRFRAEEDVWPDFNTNENELATTDVDEAVDCHLGDDALCETDHQQQQQQQAPKPVERLLFSLI